MLSPTCSFSTAQLRDYLPFTFGVEFEMIVRPKANMFSADDLLPEDLPRDSTSRRVLREYSLHIRHMVAKVLTDHGMPCNVFEPEEGGLPDYNKWTVTLDASISKLHMIPDHFFPIEVVSPKIVADRTWVETIDNFWSSLLVYFELRRDTSCGFHIHISTVSGGYSLEQLRMMAKAIIFWEPATKRCTPPSRHDRFVDFCKSNIAYDVPVAETFRQAGPFRGLAQAYNHIDNAGRDNIVDYVCPDKYRSWNLLPSRTGGHGSIEFRRPPGVVTAKKAKHWIAFAMTFVEMAIQFSPSALATYMVNELPQLNQAYHPDFQEQFLACARRLGVFAILDARLHQTDEPRSLHITLMTSDRLEMLRAIDRDYQLSPNSPSFFHQ
ncbi:MAG: hypothetical protein L6R41_001297 [Letrouitia leprolyta]|nr:MAG: hypothetical protein L6R41_001297 [Letrouitia leprolyta]